MKNICHYLKDRISTLLAGSFPPSILAMIIALSAPPAYSRDVTLAWDPNSETNLAGYKLHYKSGSPGEPYDNVVTIALDELDDLNNPRHTITGLDDNENYYFVVSAYSNFDGATVESGYSNSAGTCGDYQPIRVFDGSTYDYPGDAIQEVYNTDVADGDVMELQVFQFTGDVDIDQNIAISILGGLDCDYSEPFGESIVAGELTISAGDGIIKNVGVDGKMVLLGGSVELEAVSIRQDRGRNE